MVKIQLGKENTYLTVNRISRNEMWCAAGNHNTMCHTCAKELLDSYFNEAVIYKISIFYQIDPNFTC